MLPATWLVSAVQRVVPLHIPAEHEGLVLARQRTRFDDSATREELGVTPRSLERTFTDSVRWMREANHLTPRQAGLLA
jgi:nucleoside-diphosphate-sugar epimerase